MVNDTLSNTIIPSKWLDMGPLWVVMILGRRLLFFSLLFLFLFLYCVCVITIMTSVQTKIHTTFFPLAMLDAMFLTNCFPSIRTVHFVCLRMAPHFSYIVHHPTSFLSISFTFVCFDKQCVCTTCALWNGCTLYIVDTHRAKKAHKFCYYVSFCFLATSIPPASP